MYIIEYRSNGYSRFLATKNYAFVSNACIHVRNGQVTLHMKSELQLNKLLTDNKWKDFLLYFSSFSLHLVNPYKIITNTIQEKSLPRVPLNLLVAHPRSVKNAYQFLEGTSMITHIAMHPKSFPPVRLI